MTDKKSNDLEDLGNLPGFKRGNPTYFENEVIDHLISITLELGAELWVVKDRLAHVEEILSEENKLSLSSLNTGKPSALLQEQLDKERKQIIKRIYGRLYSKYGGESAEEKSAI
ncbi:MAG: hypothetical protein OSB24_07980 [Woeseiaceae bacterium]|jgi:hypothetical protein|nr:hypothetical protein [Woeseiaceae bacterium]